MRDLIDLLCESSTAFTYQGNCTNDHMAAGLEDMIDHAQEVSYTTLLAAVGRDQLQDIFPGFDWKRRPTDLTMRNDYAVSYFRSTFEGQPCYYVRESGIEYIFVNAATRSRGATQTITASGEMSDIMGGASVFSLRINAPGIADIAQSTACTPAARATLEQWLDTHSVTTVIESDEEMTVEEFLENL